MLGWQTAFQRFKTASNNYNYNLGVPSSTTQHRNLIPTSGMINYKHGIHRKSSTSKRKLVGRLATQRNVLSNVAQSLCPIIRMEENFTAAQFIPDPSTYNGDGTAGGFAPPLTHGQIGVHLYQLVNPCSATNTAGVCDPTQIYNIENSGVDSQLVNWQSSYMRLEQDLLLAAALKGQDAYTNAPDLVQKNLDLTNAGLVFSKGIPAKDFVYRGGTTKHTFINQGNTQCTIYLYEFQPRRMGNITPQACWDYDLDVARSGLVGSANAPANLAAGVAVTARTYSKLGMRPGAQKNGMFNYWFKKLSARKYRLEPGEELTYNQVYPPWIDRHKMRDIFLSSYSNANGAASGSPEITYNSHSRFLLFIGHGENTKFVQNADFKQATFPGSWTVLHNQVRRSSYQCLLPSRRTQLSIVDTPDTFQNVGPRGTAITETDFNEESDIQHTVAT